MDHQNIALQRVNLRNLNPNMDNVLIVGVIIGKQRPKKLLTKTTLDVHKAVWNFTLRDSPQDYINVSYWESSEVIFSANDKFHTGDVVEVINPRINIRKINDCGEQFRPMVTSPYHLSLSERSALIRHEGSRANFLYLLRLPTKPIAGFLPLRDVQNSGASIKDTNVDILAVVRSLGDIRTVVLKNTNENVQVRSIEVFDHTCPSLKIDLWEFDVIVRSEQWKPRCTVLFFTDLRVQWSPFQKQYSTKFTSRTIVTENPEGRETQQLLDYAKVAPIETDEIVDQLMTTIPDPNIIQDVMSVKQVQDKINTCMEKNGAGPKQFTALLFAFVSSLDLDGLTRTLLIKCGRCKMPIKNSSCENSECSTVYDREVVEPDITFDIRTTLTDHTGTLINCRFSGQAPERALECTAREFSNMSDDQKCKLKWKYLMERCAVYIAVLFVGKQLPVIIVLRISLANSNEVTRRLPVY